MIRLILWGSRNKIKLRWFGFTPRCKQYTNVSTPTISTRSKQSRLLRAIVERSSWVASLQITANESCKNLTMGLSMTALLDGDLGLAENMKQHCITTGLQRTTLKSLLCRVSSVAESNSESALAPYPCVWLWLHVCIVVLKNNIWLAESSGSALYRPRFMGPPMFSSRRPQALDGLLQLCTNVIRFPHLLFVGSAHRLCPHYCARLWRNKTQQSGPACN